MTYKFLPLDPAFVNNALSLKDAWQYRFAIVFDSNNSAFAFKVLSPAQSDDALVSFRLDILLLATLPQLAQAFDRAITTASNDEQVINFLNLLIENIPGTVGYRSLAGLIVARINSLIAEEMNPAPVPRKKRKS